ncbi:hypothetical protein CU669_08525 [Paramagnetospirillum kuznetsovii]|uniref:Hemerythrin-like domain-containing protein n=1 Tax=Paramagnetospirillum kuznetsovii TaxID=2053833 RepID=A0A364NYP7_9PROT|nr:hypothetical protein [Paramagnetospirillum kuznetsovii]RAU22173.1 hypothetical protein CU669_08525 [Paramagnetospirillum kuznetsovii]
MKNEKNIEILDLSYRDRFVAAYKMYASGVEDISSFFAADEADASDKSIASILRDEFAQALHSFSIKSVMIGGYHALTQGEAVVISDFFDEYSFAEIKNDDALTALSKILEAAPLQNNANKCFDQNLLGSALELYDSDIEIGAALALSDNISNKDIKDIIDCEKAEHSIIKENYYQMISLCGSDFDRPRIFKMAHLFLSSVRSHFEHEELLIQKFDDVNFENHCAEHIDIILSISVLIDEIQVTIIAEELFTRKLKFIEDRIMMHASSMDAALMNAILIGH